MFKCGHDCLDDKNSMKQAEKCIDECGQTMHLAMNTIQTEINAFQVSAKSKSISVQVDCATNFHIDPITILSLGPHRSMLNELSR